MRLAYVQDRIAHTGRDEWLKEEEHVRWTIKFLREEIRVRSRPSVIGGRHDGAYKGNK
jgi:hypothetical protein